MQRDHYVSVSSDAAFDRNMCPLSAAVMAVPDRILLLHVSAQAFRARRSLNCPAVERSHPAVAVGFVSVLLETRCDMP
jgi:hypothetical protein